MKVTKSILRCGKPIEAAYIRFLRDYRMDHPFLTPVDTIRYGTIGWTKLPLSKKMYYIKLAFRGNSPRVKDRWLEGNPHERSEYFLKIASSKIPSNPRKKSSTAQILRRQLSSEIKRTWA